MTRGEFLDRVVRLERELPVASWRAGDLLVWPIIRIQLFAANLDSTVGSLGLARATSSNGRALVSGLSNWARAASTDWAGNVRPTRPADAVFLAYSIGRQPIVSNRAVNPLLQPYAELVQQAGYSSVVWEMSPTGEYNVPRTVPSTFIQPLLYAARVRTMRAGTPADMVLDGYDRFVEATNDLVNRYQSRRALARDVAFVDMLRRMFRRWLRRGGARFGFVADYALPNLAFCQACRDEGAETIEIQHGVQDATHPVYAAWEAVPPGGFPMRPRHYWCWDAESAAAVNAWAHPRGLPGGVVGGNPWRDRWLDDTSESSAALHQQLRDLRQRAGANLHVLVTLDPTGDVIPTVLLDTLRRAPRDWSVWLRLHPVNQAQRLPEAERLVADLPVVSVPVATASSVPLHALLSHVDVHVTACWSSVIGEAAAAGISSVACHERADEVFPDLAADGRLVVSRSADAILKAVEAQAKRRSTVVRSTGSPSVSVAAMNHVLHGGMVPAAQNGAA
jgi:hypothetical protein